MAVSATTSINTSDSITEDILQLNYTIFESFDPKNSTENSNYSKTKYFPEISAITPNQFSENSLTDQVRKSISPSEASTETITYKTIAKAESMKSDSSHSSSSLTSSKLISLEGLPALHPIQVKILKEVRKNLEITRDKVIIYLHTFYLILYSRCFQVKKLEIENRQIPFLRKRLDQLETELRFQNITSPEDASLDFSNLLSSSIPVSRLSSSPILETEPTPALLLAEIYRVLNCDGSVSY